MVLSWSSISLGLSLTMPFCNDVPFDERWVVHMFTLNLLIYEVQVHIALNKYKASIQL
jgi:hypothetical protein